MVEAMEASVSASQINCNAAIHEAAQRSIQSAHRLFNYMAPQRPPVIGDRELSLLTNEAIAQFKKLLSLLNASCKTNDAKRIRKGPLPNFYDIDFNKFMDRPRIDSITTFQKRNDCVSDQELTMIRQSSPSSVSLGSSSGAGKQLWSYYLISSLVQGSVNDLSVFSLNRTHTSEQGSNCSARCSLSTSGGCHCSKRRKVRVKRSIRVPSVSGRTGDMPSDDYSWRKYGQKPIKGSPHPRSYYKCSSMRSCPARKQVERCMENPNMMTITYEGEHNHPSLILSPSILFSNQTLR